MVEQGYHFFHRWDIFNRCRCGFSQKGWLGVTGGCGFLRAGVYGGKKKGHSSPLRKGEHTILLDK